MLWVFDLSGRTSYLDIIFSGLLKNAVLVQA